jgi:hypothetical protein
VLSKLRHFRSAKADGNPLNSFDGKAALANLEHRYGSRLQHARAIEGGTLGAGFLGRLDARDVFIKTHRVASAKTTLRKEFALLNRAYASLGTECIATGDPHTQRLWLITEALQPPAERATPGQVLDVISAFQDALTASKCCINDTVQEDLADLLEAAERSLSAMSATKLLGSDVARRVDGALNPLRQQFAQLPRCVCHGDLSPANLLCHGHQLVAIDWEDAFLGVAGYDYLYWLTFMSNRHQLQPEVFGQTALGKPLEIALLLLIVVIKCEISRCDGNHVQNTLSFDDRLSEILLHA